MFRCPRPDGDHVSTYDSDHVESGPALLERCNKLLSGILIDKKIILDSGINLEQPTDKGSDCWVEVCDGDVATQVRLAGSRESRLY